MFGRALNTSFPDIYSVKFFAYAHLFNMLSTIYLLKPDSDLYFQFVFSWKNILKNKDLGTILGWKNTFILTDVFCNIDLITFNIRYVSTQFDRTPSEENECLFKRWTVSIKLCWYWKREISSQKMNNKKKYDITACVAQNMQREF